MRARFVTLFFLELDFLRGKVVGCLPPVGMGLPLCVNTLRSGGSDASLFVVSSVLCGFDGNVGMDSEFPKRKVSSWSMAEEGAARDFFGSVAAQIRSLLLKIIIIKK